jgi:tRNA pseudouridine55 synthase
MGNTESKAGVNRLFVVDKGMFRSSNGYMRYIKKKYDISKAGFSGTLDPFATGCLIVATGQYTKLFRYLDKAPKKYRATLWLGLKSDSLDIENVREVEMVGEFDESVVRRAVESLEGELEYLPPRYSAKKFSGRRACDISREGGEVEMKKIDSTIYDISLLLYNHPFVHFEATVSEGTYIRSLGEMIADSLGVSGALSSLRRVSEGKFHYDGEKPLNPFLYLNLQRNDYLGDHDYLELGKKLSRDYFSKKEDGKYLVETKNFYSIIEISEGRVSYLLNRLEKFEG